MNLVPKPQGANTVGQILKTRLKRLIVVQWKIKELVPCEEDVRQLSKFPTCLL